MTPLAYYNEKDPFCAEWLRNLVANGLICPGHIDQRDILDVRPGDLDGYTQCHFFAGIGLWSLALRWAGFPDTRPIWTGSCPCQPFSQAGSGAGFADARHLWPAWEWLISQCLPVAIAGEQVGSTDGTAFVDVVSASLEARGYTVGAVDIPVSCLGGPNIRQRLWWVADRRMADPAALGSEPGHGRSDRGSGHVVEGPGTRGNGSDHGATGWLADAGRPGNERGLRSGHPHGAPGAAESEAWQRQRRGHDAGSDGGMRGLADADRGGRGELRLPQPAGQQRTPWSEPYGRLEDGRLEHPEGGGRGEHGLLSQAPGGGGDARQPAQPDEAAGRLADTAGTISARSERDGDARGIGGPPDGGGLGNAACIGSSPRSPEPDARHQQDQPERPVDAGERLGNPDRSRQPGVTWDQEALRTRAAGAHGNGLEHAGLEGLPHTEPQHLRGEGRGAEGRAAAEPGRPPDPWGELQWIPCRDGRWRPTQSGIFPLAPRHPGDVARLRAYGNAISPVVAAEVIAAWMECAP